MRVNPYPEHSYEEVVGTPDEVAKEAVWPDPLHTPTLKQLVAQCRPGKHLTRVGTAFRWRDEEVRLDDTRTTTLEGWLELRWADPSMVLPCGKCGRDQIVTPRGWTEVPQWGF